MNNGKVNKISLLLEMEGKGLVNYNGDRPPKRFTGQMYHDGKISKNGSFGKEYLYTEEVTDELGNKKTIEVPKKIISGNLLRKEIVGDENQANSDRLSKDRGGRISLMSQDNVIARGFMYVSKTDSYKRKGAICVTAAEQISGAVTSIETRSKSGKKTDTSLFYKETCGDITYRSEIFFDIKQMHFISTDDNYDRASMDEKDVPNFIQHIDGRYGKGSAVYGNWGTTHKNIIGEQGVLLNSKVVTNIVREVIKGVLGINIYRNDAYAKTSGIKIALGYEGESINLLANPKFVDIYSIEDFDKLIEGVEIGIDFLPIEPTLIEKVEKKPKEEK
jgi:hypothetical protein